MLCVVFSSFTLGAARELMNRSSSNAERSSTIVLFSAGYIQDPSSNGSVLYRLFMEHFVTWMLNEEECCPAEVCGFVFLIHLDVWALQSNVQCMKSKRHRSAQATLCNTVFSVCQRKKKSLVMSRFF